MHGGEKFCFASLDCDIYESYKECLEFFYPRLVPGGVVLFDEYNDPPWPGCNKAVDEFLADKPEQLEEIESDNFIKYFFRKQKPWPKTNSTSARSRPPKICRSRSSSAASASTSSGEEGTDDYALASRLCPHQGGMIRWEANENCFRCPLHNWVFDCSGEGMNTSQGMTLRNLERQGGGLWLTDTSVLEREARSSGLRLGKHSPTLTSAGCSPRSTSACSRTPACRSSTRDRELLVDPWLDGPAMLGAWRQYPIPEISIAELDPSAIIITHEHSDHFHLPTLRHFPRDTPIYIPAFANERMQDFLAREGFKNVQATAFEKPTEIFPEIGFTYFRPVSVFNDSIISFDIDGYKFLNLNDAGLSTRTFSDIVGPVDLVACIFSTGASGYPLAWEHIDAEEKRKIMERACRGRLEMLWEAAHLYDANYIMPFASHVRLWQPEHREYLRTLITNSIDNVVDFFTEKGGREKLVDMIPGDAWHVKDGSFERLWEDRKSLYVREKMIESIEQDWGEHGGRFPMEDYWGTERIEPTEDQVKRYFLYLNNNPDIGFCEDLFLTVRCMKSRVGRRAVRAQFQDRPGGQISTVDEVGDEFPQFRMDVKTRDLSQGEESATEAGDQAGTDDIPIPRPENIDTQSVSCLRVLAHRSGT